MASRVLVIKALPALLLTLRCLLASANVVGVGVHGPACTPGSPSCTALDTPDSGSLLQLPRSKAEAVDTELDESVDTELESEDAPQPPKSCSWQPEEQVPPGLTSLDCWRPATSCAAAFVVHEGQEHYGCTYLPGSSVPQCANRTGTWSDCTPTDCAPATSAGVLAAAAATGIKFPLQTSGRYILDSELYRVKWVCLNWYGAHMKQKVHNGLDMRSAEDIAQQVKDWGFNCVRLNYAVEGYMTNPQVQPSYLTQSSGGSAGRTYLSVFDEVVAAVTSKGLMVILNNHMSDFGWCCSLTDDNGLWYNKRWPEETFLMSVYGMSRRYRNNPLVVAHDTRNEIRPSGKGFPVWAGGSKDVSKPGLFVSMKAAQQRAAGMVLQAAQGKQLVVIEANFYASLLCEGELTKSPFQAPCSEKRLVYSFHEYKHNIRLAKAAAGICKKGLINSIPLLIDFASKQGQAQPNETYAQYAATRDSLYGNIAKKSKFPIWIGEFGDDTQSEWWNNWIRYADELDLDLAYWSLDGYAYPASAKANGDAAAEHDEVETFGMFGPDFKSVRHPWKLADLQALQGAAIGELRPGQKRRSFNSTGRIPSI